VREWDGSTEGHAPDLSTNHSGSASILGAYGSTAAVCHAARVTGALLEYLDRAVAAGAIGFKSTAAYRAGLDLPEPSASQVAGAFRRLDRAAQARRLDDPVSVAHVVWTAVRLAAARGMPLQFHVGFGDEDVHLPAADPSFLRPLFREPSTEECRVVLLHNHPFVDRPGCLASVFPQVHVDLSLTIPLLGGVGAERRSRRRSRCVRRPSCSPPRMVIHIPRCTGGECACGARPLDEGSRRRWRLVGWTRPRSNRPLEASSPETVNGCIGFRPLSDRTGIAHRRGRPRATHHANMPLPLVGPLFVEERDGDALAAPGARVDRAVESDRCSGCRLSLLILRLRFEPHHQDVLVAVVMGEPRLHPDMEESRRTDRRDDPYLVVGVLNERRGLGTERREAQVGGGLRRLSSSHRHDAQAARSRPKRAVVSVRPLLLDARLAREPRMPGTSSLCWFRAVCSLAQSKEQ
jgi:hypothetical protein